MHWFERFFNQVSQKFVPKEQSVIIDSGDGFAPNRRQVIIWTSDAYFTDANKRQLASVGQRWLVSVNNVLNFTRWTSTCTKKWNDFIPDDAPATIAMVPTGIIFVWEIMRYQIFGQYVCAGY